MTSDDTTETIATFTHDGRTYEIDHLGITHPDTQWGEYAVFCGDRMVSVFDHGANLKPEYRLAEPTTDEVIAMAKRALAVDNAHEFAGTEG
jgi:hypothetical protein